MMDGRPLDLTPLDLAPDRRAALSASILARAEVVLARRAPRGPVALLTHWRRPALVAAAVVAAIAVGALYATLGKSASSATTTEALGFPGPVVAWVEAGRQPSLEELVVTMAEDSR
jgi:acyl-CoA reductase-like NAD-dependent aldehyde dehydrogenase